MNGKTLAAGMMVTTMLLSGCSEKPEEKLISRIQERIEDGLERGGKYYHGETIYDEEDRLQIVIPPYNITPTVTQITGHETGYTARFATEKIRKTTGMILLLQSGCDGTEKHLSVGIVECINPSGKEQVSNQDPLRFSTVTKNSGEDNRIPYFLEVSFDNGRDVVMETTWWKKEEISMTSVPTYPHAGPKTMIVQLERQDGVYPPRYDFSKEHKIPELNNFIERCSTSPNSKVHAKLEETPPQYQGYIRTVSVSCELTKQEKGKIKQKA